MSSAEATATATKATESMDGSEAVAMPSLEGAAGGLAAALSQWQTVTCEVGRLGLEFTRIAAGRSSVAPAEGDRRFSDPAWTSNPLFRMIGQGYLASAGALDRILDDLGAGEGRDARAARARFAANILTSAAAPDELPGEQSVRDQARLRHRRRQPSPGRPQLRLRRAP